MFLSLLITGATTESRQTFGYNYSVKKGISPADILSIPPEGETIKIDHIRALSHDIALTPVFGRHKAVMLVELQNSSLESQHALLKILEEPPLHSLIIITVDRKEHILPTAVSRCMVIKLRTEALDTAGLVTITHKTAGERLSLAAVLSETKETAIEWIQQTIVSIRQELLSHYNLAGQRNNETMKQWNNKVIHLRKLDRSLSTLQNTQTNPRLLLENLLLELDLNP